MKKTFLTIFLSLLMIAAFAQTVHYGNNPDAGDYVLVNDARIYYEVYGSGDPVLLLHGGLFGYIDEYEELIPVLSKHFQVIAVALRGHGKSEIGTQPITYSMLAEDAHAVLRKVTKKQAIVVGFNTGAITGMWLNAEYPERVKKLVFIGGMLTKDQYKPNAMNSFAGKSGDYWEENMPDFVNARKALMPEPERWDDFVEKLNYIWDPMVYVSPSQVMNIMNPVMIVIGDRDQYSSVLSAIQTYEMLPNARIAVVPNSDHVVFYYQPEIVENILMSFVTE